MNLTQASLCAVLVLGSAAASHAAIIVRPTGATAASSPVAGVQYQVITKIIDGSGLSTALNTGDAVPGTGFWPTHSNVQSTLWVADASDAWPGGNPLTWTVKLTLGSAYTLAGFHLWNEAEDEALRSAKNYTVSFSTDDSLYTPTTASPTPFLEGAGGGAYQGADYSFASPITASYVRFDITSNYGAQYVGFSEIRFITPEPSSVLLLSLGGLLLRRTRKQAVVSNQ